jgi:hypothetical protein
MVDNERAQTADEVSEAAEDRPATRASKKGAGKAAKKAAKSATKSVQAKTRSAAARRRETLAAEAVAPDVVDSKTPVTEKPVLQPSPPRTSQYLVTIDNFSGLPTRVEKVNSETGEKKELSESEAMKLAAPFTTPFTAPALASAFGFTNVTGAADSFFQESPSDDPALTDAYYRGVVDYLHALGLA